MKRRHHTLEQIFRNLREVDRLLGEGKPLVEVSKHLEVTKATHYRWLNQFGGMMADVAKRLKDLQEQQARLKRLVTDQALNIDMLKEVNRGSVRARLAAGKKLTT